MKYWYEIVVPVNDEVQDSIVGFLFDSGCIGCEERQHRIVAYFPERTQIEQIEQRLLQYRAHLAALGFNMPAGPISSRIVAEEDWHTTWKTHFKPIAISDRILVKPTWEDSKPLSPETIVIEIDPKQAFGTGGHETTRIALQLLENYIQKDDMILDIGTGTGILAIAAVKLGARKAVAFDVDQVAMFTAKENVALNKTADNTNLFVGEITAIAKAVSCFDMIFANLNKNLILEILQDCLGLLKPQGCMILTGILQEDRPDIEAAFANLPQVQQENFAQLNEWVGYVLRLRS